MFNQEHIDRIVEAIHNPPKEILDAMIALDNSEDERLFKQALKEKSNNEN